MKINSSPPSLPTGWLVNDCLSVGVDLRVSGNRGHASLAFAALALIATWSAVHRWALFRGSESLIAAVLFACLSAWLGLGDEVWHLEWNILVHRVSIGPLGRSRRFQDAELEIAYRTSTKFNISYGRLYVITDGGRHFLLDRSQQEAEALAAFISFHTGWRLR